jgi:hypothetical protein
MIGKPNNLEESKMEKQYNDERKGNKKDKQQSTKNSIEN